MLLRGVAGLLLLTSLSLAGCLESLGRPENHEPTAYEDSLCPHGPAPLGEVINYGCKTPPHTVITH
jgi:hypothetical protein